MNNELTSTMVLVTYYFFSRVSFVAFIVGIIFHLQDHSSFVWCRFTVQCSITEMIGRATPFTLRSFVKYIFPQKSELTMEVGGLVGSTFHSGEKIGR